MDEYARFEINLHPGKRMNHYSIDCRFHLRGREHFLGPVSKTEAEAEFDLEFLRRLELTERLDQYGQELTNCLFAPGSAARTALRTAREVVLLEPSRTRLRLQVRIGPSVPELHQLSWETLRDPQNQDAWLALDQNILLSRYRMGRPSAPSPLRSRDVIRALLVIANPDDGADWGLFPVDVYRWLELCATGTKGFQVDALCRCENSCCEELNVSKIGSPTWGQVLKSLNDGYDILYLVAHGTLKDEEPLLWLEGVDGEVAPIGPPRDERSGMVTQLSQLSQLPRLVVLASCESAGQTTFSTVSESDGTESHPDKGSAMLALGPRLAEAGVPAVVAMRGTVSMKTVESLLSALSEELQFGRPIDRAMSAARRFAQGVGCRDWWAPVLFMSAEDGELFDADIHVPFMAPDLPTEHVPRQEKLDELIGHLVDDNKDEVGLWGSGGYGKTTLACALCQRLREHYSGGILWVRLGPEPGQAIVKINGLIEQLTGSRPGIEDLEAARSRLVQELGERPVLLVIDDIWKKAHLDPFRKWGENCTRLYTTRDVLSLPSTAINVEVRSMKSDEALELLSRGLPRTSSDEMGLLAAKLGKMPLLLEIANRVLRHHVNTKHRSLTESLAWVNNIYKHDRLDGFPDVAETVEMSIEELSEKERAPYHALAIFPKGADLPLSIVQKLWQATAEFSAYETEQVCDHLFSLALLGYDTAHQTYRLHDMLWDYLASRLPDPVDLLHAGLLDVIRAQLPGNGWCSLDDDGYIYGHLTWHMEEAGRIDEIHKLLREETESGRNGWFEVREQVGQTAGYLTDIVRAWSLARATAWDEGLAIQCLYALVTASFNSRAANIHPEMLAALVTRGVWTQAQGLAYGRQVPVPRRKADALVALAPCLLDDELQADALTAAQEITDERARAVALTGLLLNAPEGLMLQMRDQALTSARGIEDPASRAELLAKVVPCMPEGQRDRVRTEVLDAVCAIDDEWARARALSERAPDLTEDLLKNAVAAARGMKDPWARAEALGRLVPHLSDEIRESLLKEALAVVPQIKDDRARAEVLAGLAPYLTADLLKAAFEAARKIEPDSIRADALAGLASCGSAEWVGNALDEAVAAVRGIEDGLARAKALVSLVLALPEGRRESVSPEALEAVGGIEDEGFRARALAELAPSVLENLIPEALKIAQGIHDVLAKAEALAGLAPRLADTQQEAVLREALELALQISDLQDRTTVLTALAPHMAASLLVQAVRALEIGDRSSRVLALAGLAPCLPEESRMEVLAETLSEIGSIENEQDRMEAMMGLSPHLEQGQLISELAQVQTIRSESVQALALAGLAQHLKGAQLETALATAQTIVTEGARAQALIGLAPYLTEMQLTVALGAVREIKLERECAQALAGLAPHLKDGQLQVALTAARAIRSEWARAEALTALAQCLSESSRSQVLDEALTAARAIGREWARAEALAGLAQHLSEPSRMEVLDEALEAAQAIGDKWTRTRVLERLVQHLTGPSKEQVLEDALTAAQDIDFEKDRAQALASLAQHLEESTRIEILKKALEVAREITAERNRAQALGLVVLRLAELPPEKLHPLLGDTFRVLAARTRQDFLSDLRVLAPVLLALGGEKAIAGTYRAIKDVGRWWP
jgi:hypothetical protein